MAAASGAGGPNPPGFLAAEHSADLGTTFSNVSEFLHSLPSLGVTLLNWEGKRLELLADGRVSIIGGWIPRTSSARINEAFYNASRALPIQEKLALAPHLDVVAEDLWVEGHCTVTMMVQDRAANAFRPIEVPWHFCAASKMLSALLAGGFREATKDKDKVPRITLPWNIGIDQFGEFLLWFRAPRRLDSGGNWRAARISFETSIMIYQIFSYFSVFKDRDWIEEHIRIGTELMGASPEELLAALPLLLEYEINNPVGLFLVSSVISEYFEKRRLEEMPFAEALRSIQEINSAKLGTLELTLRVSGISDQELILLQDAFPNIVDLHLYRSPLTEIPVRDSSSGVAVRWENLREFTAVECRALTSLAGLDGAPNLRRVRIALCGITRVPVGLIKLEELTLESCYQLADISGLDGLPALEILKVLCGLIRRVPVGCLKLKELTLESCYQLDYSSLDGLPVKRLNVSGTLIRCVPAGLIKLEELELYSCPEMTDTSALNGLPELRSVKGNGSRVKTDPPTGCPKLTSFHM